MKMAELNRDFSYVLKNPKSKKNGKGKKKS
jgi:hypothetical protein